MVEWGAVWWVVIGRVCAHGVGRATISERRYIKKVELCILLKKITYANVYNVEQINVFMFQEN